MDTDKYVYDACCERCGTKLGEVAFPAPRPAWAPRAAGLACGPCVAPPPAGTAVVEGVV